ncbi:uncharacterized protein LOC134210183 [Armigeres subalbatus]|uniref:uncharacterized protein LOC134210183 n=1 Tax=Armigeres subalbatus TaxID=124917 RepID=UPI002ED56BBF
MVVETISGGTPESEEVEINSSLDGIIGQKKENIPPNKLKQVALATMEEKYGDRGRILTNASKAGRLCGIGVFIQDYDVKRSFRLEGDISITAAELHALSVALQFVVEGKLYNYVIYTDSMTACQMLEDAVEANKAETLLKYIIETARKWRITFQWIPSHVGISGNEVADQLAREGLTQTAVLEHQLFAKDVMRELARQKTVAAQRWYEDYSKEKGKMFFELHKQLQDKPWYHDKELKGQEVRLLNRLMTGHTYARNWLAKMKIIDDGDCELCDEEETSEHTILFCPDSATSEPDIVLNVHIQI